MLLCSEMQCSVYDAVSVGPTNTVKFLLEYTGCVIYKALLIEVPVLTDVILALSAKHFA
jgi:hypothetical protein